MPSSIDLSSDSTVPLSVSDDFSLSQHTQPGGNNNFSSNISNYTWFAFNREVVRFKFPTVLLANVRGSLCTKNDELSVLFSNNCVDIAVLTETWLNDGIIDDLIHLTGWPSGRRGGCLCKTGNFLLSTAPV